MLVQYFCNEHGRFQFLAIILKSAKGDDQVLLCTGNSYIEQATQLFIIRLPGLRREHGIWQTIATAWFSFLFPEGSIATSQEYIFKFKSFGTVSRHQVHAFITSTNLHQWKRDIFRFH